MMTEEPKKYEKPEDVPQEERVATLHAVWTKDGQVLMVYPKDLHLTAKITSMVLDMAAKKAFQDLKAMEAAMAEQPRVLPATGKLPIFDPKYLRKPGVDS
jgi:hypothetical protein